MPRDRPAGVMLFLWGILLAGRPVCECLVPGMPGGPPAVPAGRAVGLVHFPDYDTEPVMMYANGGAIVIGAVRLRTLPYAFHRADSPSRSCFIHGLIAFESSFGLDLTPPGSVCYLSPHESAPSDRFQRAGARAA